MASTVIIKIRKKGVYDMDMGERIKALRVEKGWSQEELGRMVGLQRAAINKYEKGNVENMKRSVIKRMSELFEVSPSYLMALDDLDKYSNIQYVEEMVDIPVIGTIACGDPITAEQNVAYYKTYNKSNLPSGELYLLEAKGDSMEPNIPNKSLVLCRVQNDVENGEIAAVLLNGDTEGTLKRVRKIDGIVLLEAVNPAYPPILVNEENPARIIGKAIEFTAKAQ